MNVEARTEELTVALNTENEVIEQALRDSPIERTARRVHVGFAAVRPFIFACSLARIGRSVRAGESRVTEVPTAMPGDVRRRLKIDARCWIELVRRCAVRPAQRLTVRKTRILLQSHARR